MPQLAQIRFPILNKLGGISTLGKKVLKRLAFLGGAWFHVFTAWIFYLLVNQFLEGIIELTPTSFLTVSFLFTTMYLNALQYGSADKFKCLSAFYNEPTKRLLATMQHVSFASVMHEYIWKQISKSMLAIQEKSLHIADSQNSYWARLVATAIIITVIVLLVHGGKHPTWESDVSYDKRLRSSSRRTSTRRRS